MPVELRETRLPGVGVKWTMTLARGSRLTVVQHNEGSRDVYLHRRPQDEDPAFVLQLRDDDARQLGALLTGAYERPRIVEELEAALGDFRIEQIRVPAGSWVNGRKLADYAFRRQTGATVISILRGPESVAAAQPDDVIRDGDTIVVAGRAGQFPTVRRLLTHGPALDGGDPQPRPAARG